MNHKDEQFNISMVEVRGVVKKTIPDENDTFFSDFKDEFIEELIDSIYKVEIYLREKEACPFARGNWICDIYFYNKPLICFKLPKEMTRKQIDNYFKPLLSALEERKRNKQ